jgi:hypothetical protein
MGMSIIEIVKLAGISRSTVSRVMLNESNAARNNNENPCDYEGSGLSSQTTSVALQAASLNKDVNFKTGNEAVWVSSESLRVLSRSPVMLDVLHGLEETLAGHGMTIEIQPILLK